MTRLRAVSVAPIGAAAGKAPGHTRWAIAAAANPTSSEATVMPSTAARVTVVSEPFFSITNGSPAALATPYTAVLAATAPAVATATRVVVRAGTVDIGGLLARSSLPDESQPVPGYRQPRGSKLRA